MRLARRRKVQGVGINDSDYEVFNRGEDGKQSICVYYKQWINCLYRCYSGRYPTYKDCTVCKEWLSFMTFRAWAMEQDWEGRELSKGIIQPGNQIHCPELCMFVPSYINALLTDSKATRGKWPQGVGMRKGSSCYRAYISCHGVPRHIGSYDTVDEASAAYLSAKIAYIHELCVTVKGEDPRLIPALRRIANEIEETLTTLQECSEPTK